MIEVVNQMRHSNPRSTAIAIFDAAKDWLFSFGCHYVCKFNHFDGEICQKITLRITLTYTTVTEYGTLCRYLNDIDGNQGNNSHILLLLFYQRHSTSA